MPRALRLLRWPRRSYCTDGSGRQRVPAPSRKELDKRRLHTAFIHTSFLRPPRSTSHSALAPRSRSNHLPTTWQLGRQAVQRRNMHGRMLLGDPPDRLRLTMHEPFMVPRRQLKVRRRGARSRHCRSLCAPFQKISMGVKFADFRVNTTRIEISIEKAGRE